MKIVVWLKAARPFVLPLILFNTFFAVALAGFEWSAWILSFSTISCLLLSAHFVNGWRDYVRGVDSLDEKGSVGKTYTEASQILPRGELSLLTVKVSAVGLFLAAISLLYLAPWRLGVMLAFFLVSAQAWTYTDFWKPAGLPEVSLFLGCLGVVSFTYALVRPLDLTGVCGGVLLGMWAAGMITLDQYQDVTVFERKARSLAEMVFKARMRISVFFWFTVTSVFVMQFAFVLLGKISSGTLLTIFMLPLAHVTGVSLDYNFDMGAKLVLISMVSYSALAGLGVLL